MQFYESQMAGEYEVEDKEYHQQLEVTPHMIQMEHFSRELQRKEKEIIDFQGLMIKKSDENVGVDLQSLVELPQELLEDEKFMAKYRYYTQGNYKPKNNNTENANIYHELQDKSSIREGEESGPASRL